MCWWKQKAANRLKELLVAKLFRLSCADLREGQRADDFDTGILGDDDDDDDDDSDDGVVADRYAL